MESRNSSFKPQPFRANIFQPNSPPRVSTDPEAAPKRSHLHGLHHHRHHHHHHHSSRHRAKDAVQSAVQLHPPTSFGDLLKQASKSSKSSPDGSRRESKVVPNGESQGGVYIRPAKRVRPDDVKRERSRVKAREDELRASLQGLSEQSLRTSRRLDDTYYSILEKVSVLRQTIGSLQELSALTKELHENFQSDTTDLTDEIRSQIEGFGNFETQQGLVEGLEQRITAGREKAEALTNRLAEARTQVEARAKLEAEHESRTTRRLRVFWGILGTIFGLCVLAVLIHQLKPMRTGSPKQALDFGSREHLWEADLPQQAKEALLSPSPSTSSRREILVSKSAADLDDDPRLRLFDEL